MADDGAVALPQTLTLDHVSPATRLLEKRRQMFEVQEALDAQKEEFARREEAFRRREEGLRKKDLDLQESLIRFNKFLQENESKRTRAEKRAHEEFQTRKKKDQKKGMYQKKLKEEKAERALKEKERQDLLKYQLFLERVLEEHSEDYQEIPNVVARYQTLQRANKEMAERQRTTEEQNESKREGYAKLEKEMMNAVFACNSQISDLKKSLEVAEVETLEAQKVVDSRIDAAREQMSELGLVLMAVENLWQRCVRNPHTSPDGVPIIKHEGDGDADDGKGGHKSSDDKKGKAKSDASVPLAEKSAAEIAARVKEALRQLDVISEYIVNFAAIRDDATGEPSKAWPDGTAGAGGAGGTGAEDAGRAAGGGGGGGGSSAESGPAASSAAGVSDSRATNSTR